MLVSTSPGTFERVLGSSTQQLDLEVLIARSRSFISLDKTRRVSGEKTGLGYLPRRVGVDVYVTTPPLAWKSTVAVEGK